MPRWCLCAGWGLGETKSSRARLRAGAAGACPCVNRLAGPGTGGLRADRSDRAGGRGAGRMASFAAYVSSVLHNGLGRHDAARDAAWQAFEHGQLGHGSLVVSELAEAAARTGDV